MPLSAQQLAAQKNLSYVLAEKLAQRILKGEYEPGTILPGEIELGEQFGVSRTAVREAVKTLTAKGMVLPRPRIGTRVMPQSNWNFLDQELLTWWMTEENFRRERWIEVDMAWHEHIYEMSANPFLTSFASLFHSVYHTYFTSITSDTVIKLDLHQAIVDAIVQSDGDAAFKACQALLRSPDK